ncbi:hypothetical protein L204_101925 [Cryptococcus depauperatus]|nr:hypothetical protein L204_05575 [Cryptococcus depauperatus CBS 7855]
MPKTDFWSPTYWTNRFSTEDHFEWLVQTEYLISLVEEMFCSKAKEGKANILHLGCGSSTLGTQLQARLDTILCGRRSQVVDADYVDPPAFVASAEEEAKVPFMKVNVLSLESLVSIPPMSQYLSDGVFENGWDFVLDKSTCDAISTSPNLSLSFDGNQLLPSDPVERMVYNLSKVTKKNARWVSVSYSPTRYDFLPFFSGPSSEKPESVEIHNGPSRDIPHRRASVFGWRVLEKRLIAMTSVPEGRRIRDGAQERIVYEPETGVWMYVLERI